MARGEIRYRIVADPTEFKRGVDVARREGQSFAGLAKTGFGLGAGIAIFDQAVASIGATARAVGELVERGSKVTTVSAGFRSLVKDSAEVLEASRRSTKGLISDFELMGAANKAALLGLDTTTKGFAELSNAAVVLGRAMGQDATKSLNDLVQGLGKGEVELLDNLGLAIKAEDAYRKFAEANGLVAAKLTLAQKQQALYSDALEKARERVATLGDIQLTLGDRAHQAGIAVGNLVDKIGEVIAESPEMNRIFEESVESLQDFARWVDENKGSLAALVSEGLRPVADLLKGIKATIREIRQLGSILDFGGGGGPFPSLGQGLTALSQFSGAGLLAAPFRALAARGAAENTTAFGGRVSSGPMGPTLAQLGADPSRFRGTVTGGGGGGGGGGPSISDQLAELIAAGRRGRGRAGLRELADQLVEGIQIQLPGLDRVTGSFATVSGVPTQDELLAQFNQEFPGGMGLGGMPGGVPGSNANLFRQGRDLGRIFEGLTLATSAVLGEFDQVPQIMANVARSFESATTGADKFAAIALGIGQIGGLIGGRTGSAIQGAAGGALTGFQFGGPIGAAIGGGLGLLGGLFGGPSEHQQVNDLRDDFFAQWENGFVGLQQQLQGLTDQDLVRQIFDATTVEEFNAAVAEAMGLLDTQVQAQQALSDAVQRYGFEISELGPTMRQQELDRIAGGLIQDFELLTASGIEQQTVLERMAPAMQDYIDTALAAGSAIPEAMRGPIESLIEMGLLTDEAGNPFSSLEESGIQFTESLTDGLSRVIESIDRLVAALTGIPPVHVPVTVGSGDLPTPANDDFSPDIPRMQHGGILRANPPRGRLFVGGEREDEVVIPISQFRGGMGGVGSNVSVSLGGVTIHVSGAGNAEEVAKRIAEGFEQGTMARLDSAIRERIQAHGKA